MTQKTHICTCSTPCTMTVKQTADMMECSKTTVLRNIRSGALKAKMTGNRFQVRTTSVLRALKKS